MNENQIYDVAVIGAGPGGYSAAFRAADLGKKVILIEKNSKLGGVCLNRGCIPSKALLHLTKIIEEAKALKQTGVTFDKPQIDLDAIRHWKDSVVNKLNKGISNLVKIRKIEVMQGTATFDSPTQLSVKTNTNNCQTITFDNCIIATGSRSSNIPGFPAGHPLIINSTVALKLREIPKRLLVIGGGYIGLELGSVYNALGSKVTVVEFMPNLLPGADEDLVKPLAQKLRESCENIYLSTNVVKVEPDKNEVTVHFKGSDKKEFSAVFDTVLISVGRKPNTENIGIEDAGIDLTHKGFISVNEKRQTSVPNIYAIGDITGDPMLAHKATHEGKVAAEVIAELPSAFEPEVIPAVIFTDPEIAWVGPTETELKARGIPYEKGEFPWAASGKALALNRIEGKTKLLFNPDSKIIISAGIVGPNAGDLIGEAVLAIEMGADAEDIGLSIHPHPTLTETVANAAEMFSGTITDLYIPKEN